MNKKLKEHLKFVFLLIGIPILLLTCQKEDYQQESEQQPKIMLDLKAYKLPTDSIFEVKEALKTQLTQKFPIQDNGIASKLTYENSGFSINTDFVQLITSSTYESFTFLVERENSSAKVLENYVLTLYNDGDSKQMLISYPIIESDGEITYDIARATVQRINDSNLLPRANTMNTCEESFQEIIEWDPSAECIPYNCTAGGNHVPGEECNGTAEQQPYIQCIGGWVVTGCTSSGGGGGGGSPGMGGNGGGGNGDGSNDNEEEEIPVVPFDDLGVLGVVIECNKIKNLLQDNPAYKQELIDLAATVNQDHENAIGYYADGTKFDQGGTTGSQVDLGDNPPSPYSTIAHTHNEFTSPTDTIQTYSIFSLGDLQFMGRSLRENQLDNDFVAFLITGKGTRYALTIHNKNKCKEFFKYLDIVKEAQAGNQQLSLELSIYYSQNVDPLLNKYYYNEPPDPIPPIRVDNNNNQEVLLEFLKFMGEADLGMTLFSADANFENFQRLKLGKGATNVASQDCNN